MTTKELIKILNELDPDGNMEVCLDDGWGESFDEIRIATRLDGEKFIAMI